MIYLEKNYKVCCFSSLGPVFGFIILGLSFSSSSLISFKMMFNEVTMISELGLSVSSRLIGSGPSNHPSNSSVEVEHCSSYGHLSVQIHDDDDDISL